MLQVQLHQTSNSNQNLQPMENGRKQCLNKAYTSLNSYLSKQNRKVLSNWKLQYSRRPLFTRLDNRKQTLNWRVFLPSTELFYCTTAFEKRKHIEWKWQQLLTRNYICLQTAASFLAHFLQAALHFPQHLHLALRFSHRGRHFHIRGKTMSLQSVRCWHGPGPLALRNRGSNPIWRTDEWSYFGTI